MIKAIKNFFFASAIISVALFFAVSPVLAIIPNDPDFQEQWYLKQIKATESWHYSTGSEEVVVAVLDSGVDIDHPDLKNNIWVNADEVPGDGIDNDNNGFVDDAVGWDFISDSPDPRPQTALFTEVGLNHGTAVAGLIAAEGNNREGISGVAWNVKIMPVRVISNIGGGNEQTVIKGIDYAIQNGADIINMSFVGFESDRSFFNALERAKESGVLVVAAAGNEQGENGEGLDLDEIQMYPACYDSAEWNLVLGVAATDTLDQKADFSNYGHDCIDLSAPGVSIYTTGVVGNSLSESGYLKNWSGTSLASPLVAGAAALIKSYKPKLSVSQIQDILINNADSVKDVNPVYYEDLGSGRLNILKAMVAAAGAEPEEAKNIVVIPEGMEPVFKAGDMAVLKTSEKNSPIYIFENGVLLGSWKVYDNFAGKLSAKAGDISGNGNIEVITSVRSGGGPQIRIFSRSGSLLGQFMAYENEFRGGINLSLGDIDGDGRDEIITAPRGEKEPLVKVFNDKGNKLFEFLAYAENFRGGVNLSSGDTDGDGRAEIITAPASAGGPHIRIFKANGELVEEFMARESEFRGGINITSDNFDAGGEDEIAVSFSQSKPTVKIFNGRGGIKNEFLAYAENFRGGVNLSSGDTDGDGRAEIITAPASAGGSHIRIFSRSGEVRGQFFAFDTEERGGYETIIFD